MCSLTSTTSRNAGPGQREDNGSSNSHRFDVREADQQQRIESLYRSQMQETARTMDRRFAVLLVIQYFAGIAAALWISPKTWTGTQSSIHFHVWIAIALGAVITSFPVGMALLRSGTTASRHVIAAAQMAMSALLIHVTGGRIETHFHIFGSLAFLAFYRDPAVLVTASAVVGADHLLRGIFWPQSVFGVVAASSWRWLEHAAWVVFEDIFLIISIRSGQATLRGMLEYRVEVERARDEAMQASRAKDDFIAVLSHELRTPLTPSLLDLSDLEADPRISPEVRQRLHLIKRSIEIEAHLIDDLLDVTRIAHGKVSLSIGDVDLHECLAHALTVKQADIRAKRLRVETKLSAASAVVSGDENRIRQVLLNLIGNAIKFTPEGGWIRLTSEVGNESVRLEVADSGFGIPAGLLPMLFQRFEQGGHGVTRKFGGLGLGLSIARSIVELHGGKISARSPGEGQGATFSLEFPAHQNPHSPRPMGAPPLKAGAEPTTSVNLPHERKTGFRILLVDDHSETRDILSRLLRKAGHHVLTAESVATALEEVRENDFDLLLSDIGLPDGSGHDIMNTLGDKPIKGIALSGFGTEQDIQSSMEAGFSAHLTKPIDFPRLKQTVAEIGMAGV